MGGALGMAPPNFFAKDHIFGTPGRINVYNAGTSHKS